MSVECCPHDHSSFWRASSQARLKQEAARCCSSEYSRVQSATNVQATIYMHVAMEQLCSMLTASNCIRTA